MVTSPLTRDFEHQTDFPAVASFGRGAWSFFDFLQWRKQRLTELKHRFETAIQNESFVALDRDSAKPNIYIGAGIGENPFIGSRDLVWLSTAPVLSRPMYPVALDVIEAARAVAPDGLIAAAAAAVAPAWEDLERYGLTQVETSRPRWDDVQGSDGDVMENYLLTMAARGVVSLGSGFGVILRSPQRFDYASTLFTQKLLHEARMTGFHVALDAPPALSLDPRYRDYIKDARFVERPIRKRAAERSEAMDRATILLALCPHGAPAQVVRSLGGNIECVEASRIRPGGEPLVFLPASLARATTLRLPPGRRRKLRKELFEAWNAGGWGYLRRAGLAVAARDTGLMLAQHTAYSYGLADIGREFLYRQFSTLSRCSHGHKDALRNSHYAAVGAARLASRAGGHEGPRTAARHYRRALHLARNPSVKADLIYGIANVLAHQRLPDTLAEARRWYERGNAILHHITNHEDKVYTQIRLSNGLALVAYHQGRNEEALALEEGARSIAVNAATDYPHITNWAIPIINANTARLLEKRYSDLTGAIGLLESNISATEPHVQTHARLELSRLYFDSGKYDAVIELLSPLYETLSTDVDEHQELFGRLLLSLSLSFIGDRSKTRDQLPRLVYLLHSANTPSSKQFLSAIFRASKEYGSESNLERDIGCGSNSAEYQN